MWLNLNEEELARIGVACPDIRERIAEEDNIVKDPRTPLYVKAAQRHATDDLEVGDEALVAYPGEGGDEGAFVMAWLWITDVEMWEADHSPEADVQEAREAITTELIASDGHLGTDQLIAPDIGDLLVSGIIGSIPPRVVMSAEDVEREYQLPPGSLSK